MSDLPAVSDQQWADRKHRAANWFAELRDQICEVFEEIEVELTGTLVDQPAGRFERKPWDRFNEDGSPGGGGVMSIIARAAYLRRLGSISRPSRGYSRRNFAKPFKGAEKDGRFWASGVSLVAHMCSPLVPAVHMNTRHIVTTKGWFGGGADLTPTYPDAGDAAQFHAALKAACDGQDPEYYPRFKKWCDEYFLPTPSRRASGAWVEFSTTISTRPIGNPACPSPKMSAALSSPSIPKSCAVVSNRPWTIDQRKHQLQRRGRYVEFNLLYDRGTQFGLKTGGNVEAILMSLPPEVIWP